MYGFLFGLSLLPQVGDEAANGIQSLKEIKTPTVIGSAQPNLTVGEDGQIYLSWIETIGNSYAALQFAVYEKDYWSEPQEIAKGDNWFVNWADFPSLVAFADGALAAHWLVKSSEEKYAYDANIAFYKKGMNWSQATRPHQDGTQTEHGFVSMLPLEEEQIAVIWLDGRNYAQKAGGQKPTNEMTLRYCRMDPKGQLFDEVELDSRVCDCCQTAATRTPSGIIVVYRDRSQTEVRDISITRLHNGVWSKPRTLFPDDWEIFGCPVNGPAIDSREKNVAVAWYTAAKGSAQVKVIFSKDAGSTFETPIQVDDSNPRGRVDSVMLEDGSVLVSWIEMIEESEEIRVRRVYPNGSRSGSLTIAKSTRPRASGFPRMVYQDGRVYFAWTQAGKKTSIKTAVADLLLKNQ